MSGGQRRSELDKRAREIANEFLLKGVSLETLQTRLHLGASVSTIRRRIRSWLDQGRFELVDRLGEEPLIQIGDIDAELGTALAEKTMVKRARVVRIEGVDDAYTDAFRRDPSTEEARAANQAGDDLHKALAEVAADLLFDKIKSGMRIGLASGRAVGFTIDKLAQLAEKQPSWIGEQQSVRLVSLCGGARVQAWGRPAARSLDADESVTTLQNLFGSPVGPTAERHLIAGGVTEPKSSSAHGSAFRQRLDLAVVGLGQLNSQHHFLRYRHEQALSSIADPLERIAAAQYDDNANYFVADIAHILFTGGDVPRDITSAVDEINKKVLTAPPKLVREAREIIIVAGGAQKKQALCSLVIGQCINAPVDAERLTLVVDARTAQEILSMAT